VLEFIKKPFDGIALAVEPIREGWTVFPVRQQPDVAPGSALFEALAQAVTIVGAVCQQDVPGLDGSEHIGGRASVMSLALAQFQSHRQAIGIDKRMDFSR
jgi:hypothetical protein